MCLQKGYKVRGIAELISPDHPRFSQLGLSLLAITNGAFRILNIIVVDVCDVEPIVAPSYRLIAGTTEASQVESAMRTYGVIRK